MSTDCASSTTPPRFPVQPPAATPRFTPGQAVVLVNDYGVNWGERVIVATRVDAVRGNVYQTAPTETPWYEDPERTLFAPGDPAIAEAIEARRALHRLDPFPWV